jgi:hypothetical protein
VKEASFSNSDLLSTPFITIVSVSAITSYFTRVGIAFEEQDCMERVPATSRQQKIANRRFFMIG